MQTHIKKTAPRDNGLQIIQGAQPFCSVASWYCWASVD